MVVENSPGQEAKRNLNRSKRNERRAQRNKETCTVKQSKRDLEYK
jgi:hypothetical protein